MNYYEPEALWEAWLKHIQAIKAAIYSITTIKWMLSFFTQLMNSLLKIKI